MVSEIIVNTYRFLHEDTLCYLLVNKMQVVAVKENNHFSCYTFSSMFIFSEIFLMLKRNKLSLTKQMWEFDFL